MILEYMDLTIIVYIISSVLIVSAVSFVGALTLFFKTKNINQILLYLVSFSVGALFGDVFIHLLPEAFIDTANHTLVGIYALVGILFSFSVEKFIHWRHCHTLEGHGGNGNHHAFAYMSLVGDSVHNFIDGLIIAGAYFVSIPVGIATTVAVIMHEIPQEIGDFGILLHGGFSKGKALFFNFITALTAVAGAILGILLSNTESLVIFLIPFAAGNLIYIAGSDLIPQLHTDSCDEKTIHKSASQTAIIILGILVMMSMLLLE